MAIQYLGTTISGVSGDTKPTLTSNELGVIFVETDTDKIYQWDGDSWEVTTAGDATTSAKGVASFSSDNFAVSSGAVTIKNDGVILGTETTGNYVGTITAGTGITSTGATSGEGIAHSLSVDAAQTQITSVGALNAGSITSGFTSIDVGAGAITTTGTITAGNLSVTGTTTTVNSTNTTITDRLIELASGAGSSTADAGIIIERGSTGDNAIMAWDESADRFVFGTTTATGASTGDLTITTGTLAANLAGNVTGNVTGTADTATVATTVTLNGSGNVTYYPTFVDATSGNENIRVDSDWTYNASSNKMTVGNINIPDNGELSLGDSDDLQIGHDVSSSYIKDLGTGVLYIDSNGSGIYMRKSDGTAMATFLTDGAVTLHHNGSARVATSAAGATVSGMLTTTDGIRWGNGGTYGAGGIYSDSNWGAILTAFTASPAAADWLFEDAAGNDLVKIQRNSNAAITLAVGGTAETDWSANWDAIQIGDQTAIANYEDQGSYYVTNARYDGTNWKYIDSDFAVAMTTYAGTFQVRQAASGTADANITFSYPLTIATTGNVGIGTSSPDYLLHQETTSATTTYNMKTNASASANNYAEIAFQLWSGAGTGANTYGGSGTSRPSAVIRGLSEDAAARGALSFATFSGGSDNTNLTEKMRITSNGTINLTPAANGGTISLDSPDGAYFKLDRGATSNDATVEYYTAGALKWKVGMDSSGGATDAFEVKRTNNALPDFMINSSGNVGLGIVPNARLDVRKQIAGTTNALTGQNYNVVNILAHNYGNSIQNSTNYGLFVKSDWAGYNTAGNFTGSQGITAKFVTDSSWGVLPNGFGLIVQPEVYDSQTMTNYYGLYVQAPQLGSGSVLTNRFGVYVADSSYSNYFAGDVGVGTTNPHYSFHTHTSGNSYFHATNSNTGAGVSDGIVIGMGAASSPYIWSYENSNFYFGNNGAAAFYINTSQDMVFQNNNNLYDVGHGDSYWTNDGAMFASANVGGKVYIKSTGTNSYPSLRFVNDQREWRIYGADGSQGDRFVIYDATASSNNSRFVIDAHASKGKIGMGTVTPFQNVAGGTIDLDVSGLHIKDSSAHGQIILEGNPPSFHVMDLGGGSDDKWMMYRVDGGLGWFQSLTDNGSDRVDNILVMDMGTGHAGFNAVPKQDWNSSFQAIHLGNQTTFANFTNRGGYWMNNARYNTSQQFTYIRTDEACVIDLVDGCFRFRTAGVGSADATASMAAQFYIANNGQTVIGSSTVKGNAKLSMYGGIWVDPQTWQLAGAGNDSTAEVAMVLDGYGGIYSWFDGYNRNIIRSKATGIIEIGQGNTGIWNTIDLHPGDAGKVRIYGDDPSSANEMLIATFEDANLTLAGQIKISGGSPGADKVLTSDANGLATWEEASGGGGLSWSSFVGL